MMNNIVVTTPKFQMGIAAAEAQQCIDANGGFYFRAFSKKPKDLERGSKIFYVEDGYIRGFAVVSEIKKECMVCETTGKNWGDKYYAIMPADSWTWIKPIEMKGFQGWRRFNNKYEIVGFWKDPKPKINEIK